MAAPQLISQLPPSAATRSSAWLWLQRHGWALADQLLCSGANFVTMVLLARALAPAEFGSFTLVYSIILLANVLQSTLVTQPHNVLGSTRDPSDFGSYTTSTAVSQGILMVVLCLAAVVAANVLTLTGWADAKLAWLLAPAVFAWQGQEFCRRVLYTVGRYRAAFCNDLIGYGGQAIAVACIELMGDLDASRAIWTLVSMAALATAAGFWQIRCYLRGPIEPRAWRENWHFGKWLAGAEILQWASSLQLYLFLAAALLGTSAAGELKAAQIVFGPTRVLSFFLYSILPMQFARTYAAHGPWAVHRQLRIAYAVIVPLLGVYCLLVALLATPILRLLYGPHYVGSASLLALYAGYEFLEYMAMVLAASLSGKRLTRAIFVGYLCRASVALTCGWIFIRVLGLAGTIIGMVATTFIGLVVFYLGYHRNLNGIRHAEDVPAPPPMSDVPMP